MILMWAIFALMLMIAASFIVVPVVSYTVHNNKAWYQIPNRWLVFSLIILMIISAMILYDRWGASSELAQWRNMEQAKQSLAKEGSQQLITRMQAILAKNPNSAQGWFLLGRLYFTSGKYAEAANVFAKAYALEPKESVILQQYVNALFFANGMQLNAESQKLLAKLDANDPLRLNLLALDAYHHGHYQEAIKYWQTLLAQTPAENQQSRATIIRAIEQSQKLLKK